jgi:hypothetical protein
MQLRAVRVTIAPGKFDAYWAWAKEIEALWDAHDINRAGGPYAFVDGTGANVALWLTVHGDDEDVRGTFGAMYSTERGKALIEQRPPLVSDTVTTVNEDWDPAAGPPPAAPSW